MTDLAARKYLLWGNRLPAPSLDLNLLAGPLDSRITFTRSAGTATYFDATGTLQTAGTNVARFDNDPSTARTNLLLWSTDLSNAVWQLFNGATKGAAVIGPDGTLSGITVNFDAQATSQIFQTITTPAGTTWSVWARAGTSNSFALRFPVDGASPTFNLTAQWRQFSFTSAAGNSNLSVSNIGTTAGSIDIAMPQAELGASASGFIPTTTAAVSAGATPRGLLIEETRANIIINSAAINSWTTKTDCTVTDNNAVSPDGGTTASRIVEGSLGTSILQCAQATVAAGSTISYSMFVKRGSVNDWITVIFGDAAATNGITLGVNLTTGSLGTVANRGTATGATAAMQSVGNGWYRVTGTCTMPGGSTTCLIRMFSATTDSGVTRVSGATYFIWGAQGEIGAFPTSHIPTTAAAATRAADVATVAQAAPPTGTLAVEVLTPFAVSKAVTLLAFTGASGKTGLTANASNQVAMFDTTGAVNSSLGSEPIGVPFKAGMAFAPGVQRGCLNGGAIVTAAAVTLTASETSLGIGYDGTSQQPGAAIRRLRYWQQALSAMQLQQVTR